MHGGLSSSAAWAGYYGWSENEGCPGYGSDRERRSWDILERRISPVGRRIVVPGDSHPEFGRSSTTRAPCGPAQSRTPDRLKGRDQEKRKEVETQSNITLSYPGNCPRDGGKHQPSIFQGCLCLSNGL